MDATTTESDGVHVQALYGPPGVELTQLGRGSRVCHAVPKVLSHHNTICHVVVDVGGRIARDPGAPLWTKRGWIVQDVDGELTPTCIPSSLQVRNHLAGHIVVIDGRVVLTGGHHHPWRRETRIEVDVGICDIPSDNPVRPNHFLDAQCGIQLILYMSLCPTWIAVRVDDRAPSDDGSSFAVHLHRTTLHHQAGIHIRRSRETGHMRGHLAIIRVCLLVAPTVKVKVHA
mmetsp:Transcript_47692/g.66216  ORF Transcript_47692/g.66216 Transcript_47692/m.66216 type:complete len:229 (+) Transcript_47692:292-978(+)